MFTRPPRDLPCRALVGSTYLPVPEIIRSVVGRISGGDVIVISIDKEAINRLIKLFHSCASVVSRKLTMTIICKSIGTNSPLAVFLLDHANSYHRVTAKRRWLICYLTMS